MGGRPVPGDRRAEGSHEARSLNTSQLTAYLGGLCRSRPAGGLDQPCHSRQACGLPQAPGVVSVDIEDLVVTACSTPAISISIDWSASMVNSPAMAGRARSTVLEPPPETSHLTISTSASAGRPGNSGVPPPWSWLLETVRWRTSSLERCQDVGGGLHQFDAERGHGHLPLRSLPDGFLGEDGQGGGRRIQPAHHLLHHRCHVWGIDLEFGGMAPRPDLLALARSRSVDSQRLVWTTWALWT